MLISMPTMQTVNFCSLQTVGLFLEASLRIMLTHKFCSNFQCHLTVVLNENWLKFNSLLTLTLIRFLRPFVLY